MQRWPDVSVVMAVRDEQAHLRAAVASALSQDYPGRLELVLAVAPSRDATAQLARQIAGEDTRVRVVDNSAGTVSAGLNRAIAASGGEVLVRLDGHAVAEPGYIRRAVELLEATGADNVGGVQLAVGRTPFEQAVAAAMSSRFGVGDAKFHYGGAAGPTDTVYLGVFRRAALERVGGFDETLLRNQDYELNWRVRASGGTVYFSPELRVRYTPRGSLRTLARQYYDYGRWKREMLRRHPASLRWRQLVPPLAVLAMVLGALVAPRRPIGLLPAAGYSVAVAAAAAAGPPGRRLRLLGIYPVMHVSWGAGFLAGVTTTSEVASPDVAL